MSKIKIDVLIMGSSRPELLEITVNKFKQFVADISTNIEFNYLLHEDMI